MIDIIQSIVIIGMTVAFFFIKKGPKGDQGNQGMPGPQGMMGRDGSCKCKEND